MERKGGEGKGTYVDVVVSLFVADMVCCLLTGEEGKGRKGKEDGR